MSHCDNSKSYVAKALRREQLAVSRSLSLVEQMIRDETLQSIGTFLFPVDIFYVYAEGKRQLRAPRV